MAMSSATVAPRHNCADRLPFKPDGNTASKDHDPSTMRMLGTVEFGARLGQCTECICPVVEDLSGKSLSIASAADPAIAPSWRIKDSRCPDESDDRD